MLVAAFDPGETTGFAIVDEASDVKFSGNFSMSEMPRLIQTIAENYDITHLVVETSPYIIKASLLVWTLLEEELADNFSLDIYRIKPGMWKPFRKSVTHSTDMFSSEHEKDAVHMARFRIRQLTSRKNAEA